MQTRTTSIGTRIVSWDLNFSSILLQSIFIEYPNMRSRGLYWFSIPFFLRREKRKVVCLEDRRRNCRLARVTEHRGFDSRISFSSLSPSPSFDVVLTFGANFPIRGGRKEGKEGNGKEAFTSCHCQDVMQCLKMKFTPNPEKGGIYYVESVRWV